VFWSSKVRLGRRKEDIMREYSWKCTGMAYFNADAQLVGEELEKLEFAGELTADEVLKFAKVNPESETYKCFEWDNSIAGEKYRKIQASSILSSISVKIKEEPRETQRVYVSVKTSLDSARKFKNIKEVLKNDEEYQQLIDRAKLEFVNCREKYETLLEKEDLKNVIFELYREI
jgi:hypothetical protein